MDIKMWKFKYLEYLYGTIKGCNRYLMLGKETDFTSDKAIAFKNGFMKGIQYLNDSTLCEYRFIESKLKEFEGEINQRNSEDKK